jgi:microcystin-dependent protein
MSQFLSTGVYYNEQTNGTLQKNQHLQIETQFSNHMWNHMVPIGSILMWYGFDASNNVIPLPHGWALCDGTIYNRTDKRGTVKTPDLRGRFICCVDPSGVDASENQIGDFGGADFPLINANQLPQHRHVGTTDVSGNHNHTVIDPSHNHTYLSITDTVGSGGIDDAEAGGINSTTSSSSTGITLGDSGNHTHPFTTDASGTRLNDASTYTQQNFDNRPAFYVLAYIMKI